MRIGIIGAGRIGQVHARSVADNPDTELVVVTDPNIEGAQTLAARYGARAVADPLEAIHADDVDAVIICSPTPFHAPQILEAVRAGKPALCEKPVAGSYAAAAELLEQLSGSNPQVMLGFNRRFDPAFTEAKAAAEAGRLGTLEQVTIISRDPAAPPKEYIAVSGGLFKDMTIHDFDMARFMLGEFENVIAVGQHLDPTLADTGDFDGAVITLVTSSGQSATITNARHCATGYDQRLELFGTKGSALVQNVRPHSVQFSGTDYSAAQAPFLDFFLERYARAYTEELAAFVSAVKGKRPFAPSLGDGAAALRLAEAAEESALTGKVVRV